MNKLLLIPSSVPKVAKGFNIKVTHLKSYITREGGLKQFVRKYADAAATERVKHINGGVRGSLTPEQLKETASGLAKTDSSVSQLAKDHDITPAVLANIIGRAGGIKEFVQKHAGDEAAARVAEPNERRRQARLKEAAAKGPQATISSERKGKSSQENTKIPLKLDSETQNIYNHRGRWEQDPEMLWYMQKVADAIKAKDASSVSFMNLRLLKMMAPSTTSVVFQRIMSQLLVDIFESNATLYDI